MEKVKTYVKKVIKFIPGYRSSKKLNMIIATIYYTMCLFMIPSGIDEFLGGLITPFIIIYGYELYRKLKRNGILNRFNDGQTMQQELPVVRANIILQEGEICHYGEHASRLIPKTVTTGYTGGYAGVSFRIAKGVTLHTGGTSRKAIKENIMEKYEGEIYFTNKRIIFVSQQKGFSIPLSKLVTVTLFSNAYQLHKDETTYIIQPKKTKQFGKTLQAIINEYIN